MSRTVKMVDVLWRVSDEINFEKKKKREKSKLERKFPNEREPVYGVAEVWVEFLSMAYIYLLERKIGVQKTFAFVLPKNRQQHCNSYHRKELLSIRQLY